MWFVTEKDTESRAAMADFVATLTRWKEDHAGHQHAGAYRENLEGIHKGTVGPSRGTRFLEVSDQFSRIAVVSKAEVRSAGVDLSEIVKHSNAPSGAMEALVAWAVYTAGVGKVTLTAAYVALLKVYARYGFEPTRRHPAWATMPPDTRINAPMEMTDEKKAEYRRDKREGVFWTLSWDTC